MSGSSSDDEKYAYVVKICKLVEYIDPLNTGVVIAPHTILTAADKLKPYELSGDYSQIFVFAAQGALYIQSLKCHDQYKKDSTGSRNDIAIVKVSLSIWKL